MIFLLSLDGHQWPNLSTEIIVKTTCSKDQIKQGTHNIQHYVSLSTFSLLFLFLFFFLILVSVKLILRKNRWFRFRKHVNKMNKSKLKEIIMIISIYFKIYQTTPKKVWYIYTMEYYSAKKRNETGSFVAMWMDLETVIQSEVNQKK